MLKSLARSLTNRGSGRNATLTAARALAGGQRSNG